jgi:drug/metabolite transporter (DMT)-like permease
MTALVCWVWLREPYTVKEALAGLLAFTGVLLVARPPWLFPGTPLDPISGEPSEPVAGPNSSSLSLLSFGVQGGNTRSLPPVSVEQRTLAITLAVLGTFGASTAYATIRVIGKRAHSLVSVTYFAFLSTVGSALIILVHPDLRFVMPEDLGQWGLIAIIGLAGFALQFLLTEGLQREKGGRATNLTYLQLVFALVVERVIWGTTPPVESLFGAVLIIGAAVWVSLQKNVEKGIKATDEESSLLGDEQEVTGVRRRSNASLEG